MRRLGVLASVVTVAMISANCANSREGASSANIMGPSAVDNSAVVDTMARGGGGGGKKPGGGGTTGGGGSLALVMVIDGNSNGLPNWGDTVTFTVSTTATTEPYVGLSCSQNGNVVYGASAGFFDAYPWPSTRNMKLSSTNWSSGAADCTATLFYGANSTVLATLRFTAGA